MRRAYTIIELLGLVAVFALIFALSARPIWIMARQTPHIIGMVERQQQVDFLLGRLQTDIEAAATVISAAAGHRTDRRVLSLQGPDGWIEWQIEPGEILRMTPRPEDDRRWTLPHVEIDWSLYEAQGRPAGVEIRSRINRPLLGKQEMKFQQSRLFFLGLEAAHQ